jgi:hypothetical protein
MTVFHQESDPRRPRTKHHGVVIIKKPSTYIVLYARAARECRGQWFVRRRGGALIFVLNWSWPLHDGCTARGRIVNKSSDLGPPLMRSSCRTYNCERILSTANHRDSRGSDPIHGRCRFTYANRIIRVRSTVWSALPPLIKGITARFDRQPGFTTRSWRKQRE